MEKEINTQCHVKPFLTSKCEGKLTRILDLNHAPVDPNRQTLQTSYVILSRVSVNYLDNQMTFYSKFLFILFMHVNVIINIITDYWTKRIVQRQLGADSHPEFSPRIFSGARPSPDSSTDLTLLVKG